MALSSESKAIARALVYTGFDEYSDYSMEKGNVTARLRDINEVNYHLLLDSCGSQVWSIDFKSVGYPEKYRNESAQKEQTRDFNILIDAETGKLLRIHSILDMDKADTSRLMKSLEQTLQSDNEAGFVGFPDEIPEHQFLDMLCSTVADPTIPNELIGYYVVYVGHKGEPKHVWSIEMGGIPPEYSPGLPSTPDFPRPPLTHFRLVYDASTGKLLFGVNAP